MKPLELNCFHWDSGQSTLNELGIRPSIEESELKPVMLLNISNFSPYFEDEKEYVAIESGEGCFIAPYKYSDIKLKLGL